MPQNGHPVTETDEYNQTRINDEIFYNNRRNTKDKIQNFRQYWPKKILRK